MPPSVFVAVADPVGAGFVESMARPGGNLSLVHSALIIALAERHKLPAVYPRRSFVAAGGLISYGFNALDQVRQAAGYIDRIHRPYHRHRHRRHDCLRYPH
jgi:ABC-type uncharacterized transport system substrate-binding protein